MGFIHMVRRINTLHTAQGSDHQWVAFYIQKEFAKHALAGISQEELAVFKSVFDKISNNAEAYLQQNK